MWLQTFQRSFLPYLLRNAPSCSKLLLSFFGARWIVMASNCLVCGIQCKSYTRQLANVIHKWQKEWSSRTEDEGLYWILNLDLNGLDEKQTLCRICSRLVCELRDYEAKVAAVQSELLQRHEGRSRVDSAVQSELLQRHEGRSRVDSAAGANMAATGQSDASVDSEDDAPLSARKRRGGRPSVPTTPLRRSGRRRSGPQALDTAQIKPDETGEAAGARRPNGNEVAAVVAADTAVGDVGVGAMAGGEGDMDASDDGGPPSSDGADSAPSEAGSEYLPPAGAPGPAADIACSLCQQRFDSRVRLFVHKRNAHRVPPASHRRPHACGLCDKAFKQRGSLTTHQRMAHGQGEPCEHCGHVFRDHVLYYRHLTDAHNVRNFVCQHCGAGFARKVLLNKHLVKEEKRIRRKSIVDKLRTLQCSVCDYRPPLKKRGSEASICSRIRDHEHRAHGMHTRALQDETAGGLVGRYTCDKCDFVYACRRALEKHKYQTHRERKELPPVKVMAQCEYCGKEFNVNYLKTHQKQVHKVSDPSELMSCEYCGKQYHKYQRKHYLSHLQQVHLILGTELHCTEPHCTRTFRHQRGLLRHVQSYHNQSQSCGLCPDTFRTPWQRDKHRAEAHGQYDFVCDECGQKFFRRSELEIHQRRVHTLQLRYQCAVCSHRSEERRKLLNHEYAGHGLHRQPLPTHNPASQLSYPCPGCSVVFACGQAVKWHAWDQHQIKLNIYGRPKNRAAQKLNGPAAAAAAEPVAVGGDLAPLS